MHTGDHLNVRFLQLRLQNAVFDRFLRNSSKISLKMCYVSFLLIN